MKKHIFGFPDRLFDDFVIMAVDFDGTMCENAWPNIGKPNHEFIDRLRLKIMTQHKDDFKIILWTCRTGEKLEEAVQWCANHGLYFDAVNENIPEVIARFGDGRKITADIYIDDKSLNLDGPECQFYEMLDLFY